MGMVITTSLITTAAHAQAAPLLGLQGQEEALGMVDASFLQAYMIDGSPRELGFPFIERWVGQPAPSGQATCKTRAPVDQITSTAIWRKVAVKQRIHSSSCIGVR